MDHKAHSQDHRDSRRSPASSPASGMTRAYWMFVLNLAMSLIPMYLAMFTMIDALSDYRNNVNMLYMALTMLAPMGMIMLATMGGMYENRPLNLALYAGLATLLLASLFATRRQLLVDDMQFIDSMIPHHSGAILMCREAKITDQELVTLCGRIAAAQRAEISQMEAIAARLRAVK